MSVRSSSALDVFERGVFVLGWVCVGSALVSVGFVSVGFGLGWVWFGLALVWFGFVCVGFGLGWVWL